MKKLTIMLLIILYWCPLLKAKGAPARLFFQCYQESIKAAADSSNYKIKIVKSEMEYSQIRFTIVDNQNNPLPAIVWLNDINNKAISSVYGNEDGKIFIMIYDDTIQNMTVGIIGYGKVSIPVKHIKNKVTDIRVQLYQYTSIN